MYENCVDIVRKSGKIDRVPVKPGGFIPIEDGDILRSVPRDNVTPDLRAIIELMLEYREQLPADLYPNPDLDYLFQNLHSWHEEGDLVYALEHGKGCLVGLINDCYWTPGRRMATDMIFYVRPAYRGILGVRLLNRFEAACKDRGVASIEMNNVSPDHEAMVDRLYQRRGYRRTCITYEKEI